MERSASARRTTRLVYGAFVTVVAIFVFSNIEQVAGQIFGGGGAASAPLETVGAGCGAALQAELAAIDRARLAASTEKDAAAARSRYSRERTTKNDDAARACAADPHGTDALGALARLDRAAEAHAVREASELSPVRQAAQSFIRGPIQ